MPGWIQLVVWGAGEIEHYTENGSIGNPAESANRGMLAVGATHYWDTHTIADYSSRGPTPDDRVKPDIVGVDCGATALSPLNGFCGTSQASPHVAGMAALVRQRFASYTPAQVASYLKENAKQRETPDPNHTWGHGFSQLPSSQVSETLKEEERDALVALYNATGGPNWTKNTNWVSGLPVSRWQGVTTDPSGRVVGLSLPDNGLAGKIPSELGSLANLTWLILRGNELSWRDTGGTGKPDQTAGIQSHSKPIDRDDSLRVREPHQSFDPGPWKEPVDWRDTQPTGRSYQPDRAGPLGQ